MTSPTPHLAPLAQPWAIHADMLPTVVFAATRGARNATAEDPVAAESPQSRGRDRAGDLRASTGVAVIQVSGVITPRGSWIARLFGDSGGLEEMQKHLREAAAKPDVAGIVLDIDSPGGTVTLVPETAQLVREIRDTKPVIAVANTLAASAAYWIASAASEVLVVPSGEVGSIGVYSTHLDYSRAYEQEGITPTLISAGRHKTEGNHYEPLSDEAREEMQRRVDEIHNEFVADVAAGRGTSTGRVRKEFGEGRCVAADEAVRRGMADAVGTVDDAVTRIASKTGARGARASATAPSPTNHPDHRSAAEVLFSR